MFEPLKFYCMNEIKGNSSIACLKVKVSGNRNGTYNILKLFLYTKTIRNVFEHQLFKRMTLPKENAIDCRYTELVVYSVH